MRGGSSFLTLLALAACGRNPATTAGPSVLLVTLDTTRADHIGCYGHEGARTPHLDALAARGARFERAYAAVPLTLPSHAALLTGVHPPGTGLHVNFQGALAEGVPTLAEELARTGRRTGAFVAAWVLNREFGLARGFGRYEDLSDRETSEDRQAERRGDEVVDGALAWLEADPAAPFFAWVHLFDPHDPYEPPEGFREGFAHPYDGEIAFADAQVGRLLDWLEAYGRLADTLVIVAGDHGEALGEHGERTHGLLLYEGAMRVPWIVAGPASAGEDEPLAAGHVVREPVGLVDLVPTVLALLGIEPPAGCEGESRARALAGAAPESRPVFLESEYSLRSFAWAPLFAVVHERWKYVAAPSPELYDVLADPGETDECAAREPDRAARLRAVLERHLATSARRAPASIALGADASGMLDALGYVAGAGEPALDVPADAKDPKDMMHVLSGVMRAKNLADREEYAEAAAILAPFTGESPESDEIWSLYGRCLLELGRHADAAEALANSLRKNPGDARRLLRLGDARRGLGDDAGARESYERALAADPAYGQAHSRLGLLRGRAGDLPGALEHFRRYAELEPDSPNARANLASTLLAVGRPDEGLAELAAALALDPACRPAHETRVRALAELGRRPELVAALRAAGAELPGEARWDLQLAWVLATSEPAPGQPPLGPAGEALALAERAALTAPPGPQPLDVLAAARANAGDFAGAIAAAESALQAAAGSALEGPIRARLEAYRAGRPWRE